MKKQGNVYIRIITILLAVIVLAYFVLSMFLNSGSGYALETALTCEVGDGQTVSGFVVRSEKVLVSDHSTVVCELSEGERVGSGQRVATGYSTEDAYALRKELSAAQTELLYLESAEENWKEEDAVTLARDIEALIVQTAADISRGKLDTAQTTAAELQPMAVRWSLTQEDTPQILQRIQTLKERIAQMESSAQAGAVAITVTSAGYFSQIADGYEQILTPESIMEMSLAQFNDSTQKTPLPASNAIGRLILGQQWYFVTQVPTQSIADLEAGDRLTVNFAGHTLQNLKMKVERIGSDEDGSCILVLSCGTYLQEVTALREQTVDIIFKSYSGLHVSKQALYQVDGQTGVYVLEGARARWKQVEILYEYGEGYVVKLDKSSTSNLWPNDEIILTSHDIENGKVME